MLGCQAAGAKELVGEGVCWKVKRFVVGVNVVEAQCCGDVGQGPDSVRISLRRSQGKGS